MLRSCAYLGVVIVLSSLPLGQASAQHVLRSDATAVRNASQDGTVRGAFGVRAGVFARGDGHTGPLLGIDGWFATESGMFAFTPSLDFAVANDLFVIISGDFCFVVAPRSPVRLWVGAGGSLIDRTAWVLGQDETDLAADLLIGIDMGDDDMRFLVEVKAMFGDQTHMAFVSGLRF